MLAKLTILQLLYINEKFQTLGLWKEDVHREENNNEETARTRENSRRTSSASRKSYCGSVKVTVKVLTRLEVKLTSGR